MYNIANEIFNLFDSLQTGSITRTPLLGAGQVIQDLSHGLHSVTGGHVRIGFLGNGTVTKVIGIMVDNYPTTLQEWTYNPSNRLFNRNFACVLYELKQAGQNSCSYSSLDYAYGGRSMPAANVNMQYLQSFRQHTGKAEAEFGEISITKTLINGLGG